LDDPERAAEVLDGIEDEELRKYVPAAAKPIDAAPELACLQLGEWYMGLAEAAPAYAKPAMYTRATAYISRFLRLHETKDMDRVRAKVLLKKAQVAIGTAKMPAPAQTKIEKTKKPRKPGETAAGTEDGVIKPGKWVDLMALADPDEDTLRGEWRRRGNALVASFDNTSDRDALIAFPVTVKGNYEFQVTLVKLNGDDVFGFNLPVGSSSVTFGLGWFRQSGSGFFPVHGWLPHHKENTACVRPGRVEAGREYALHVLVRCGGERARISAHLDGKPFVSWEGPQPALTTWRPWSSPRDRITLASRSSTVVALAARLRMLSGEAWLVRAGEGGQPLGPLHKTRTIGNEEGGEPFEDLPSSVRLRAK